MKFRNTNKGITLISLVVTIIVLLILAGITIATLFGENGLITMAQKAKKEYEDASKKEQQQLTGVFERNYVTYNGQLHVDMGHLVNEHNEIFQLRGVNLGGRDYLNLYDYTIILNLKKAGINCIRIGLGPSYYNESSYIKYMENIIDNCIQLDLYVNIVFWNNGDPNKNLSSAQEYFSYWLKKYGNLNNVIYEISNEADGETTWNDIQEYSNIIIPQIRIINQNSVIIVGSPSYDSSITEIIGNTLNYNNIMYAFHRYPVNSDATNVVSLRDFNTAYYNNIPLIVTEWSMGISSGTGTNIEEANKLAQLMKEYKTSWMYYTLDPSGTYSFDILKKYSNSLEESYLTDSGKYLFNLLNETNTKPIAEEDFMLAERSALTTFFSQIKESIKKVEFRNTLNIPAEATNIKDVSKHGTGKVIAYTIKQNDDELDTLVIATNNEFIYAPENSRNLFGSFINLSSIDLGCFNTKYATNIEVMFYNTAIVELDLSNLNLEKVTDISEMVRLCPNLKTLNISNINFDNILDYNTFFDQCTSGIVVYVDNIQAAQYMSLELKKASIIGTIYYKLENSWENYIE